MKSKFLFYHLFLGFAFILFGCSKDRSIDPDLNVVDSSIVAAISIDANRDSVVVASASNSFNNLSDSAAFITIPATIVKSGKYNVSTIAYFNGKALNFVGTGTVSPTDSVLVLYPTNIGDFTEGNYVTDSIKANKIILNGDTLSTYLQLSINVISQSVPNNTDHSDTLSANRWMYFDSTWHHGSFSNIMPMKDLPGVINGYEFDGDGDSLYLGENYSLAILFSNIDLSTLPKTLTETTTSAGSAVSIATKYFTFSAGYSQPKSKLILVLKSYDVTTKLLSGTFSGIFSEETSFKPQEITNGSFKVKLP